MCTYLYICLKVYICIYILNLFTRGQGSIDFLVAQILISKHHSKCARAPWKNGRLLYCKRSLKYLVALEGKEMLKE